MSKSERARKIVAKIGERPHKNVPASPSTRAHGAMKAALTRARGSSRPRPRRNVPVDLIDPSFTKDHMYNGC